MENFHDNDIHFHQRNDDILDRVFCMAWVATAILGSAVIGAATTAFSANKAANAQTDASNRATQLQEGIFNKTQENLSPFIKAGGEATTELQNRLPFLTSPITMDQTTLENTPGYQFTKTQGLKAVQNSAAARGLGISGASLKGAATFATGLADQTYTNQFNFENTNRTNAYNRLKGLIDTGETAAAGSGVIGAQTGGQIGSNVIGAGNAQAAATNATGNAIAGGANNVGGYFAYKGLYGGSDPGSGQPLTYQPNPNGGGLSPTYGP